MTTPTQPTPVSTLAAEWATAAALGFGLFALALLAACEPTAPRTVGNIVIGCALLTMGAMTERGRTLTRSWATVIVALVLAGAALIMAGCQPMPASVAPTLGEVVSRVDVGRLLGCASQRGLERARCLGAAMLTPALDVAVERAAELAERASQALTPGAGADDVDPEALAVELDAALVDVAREIARAGA